MSATRNQRRQAPAEPEMDGEQEKEAAAEATTQVQAQPDIKAMSKEEILALLAQRRGELTQVQAVAKEKGIKVPTKAKTASDADRLMEFFRGVGYSTGMAHWGNSRVQSNLKRIEPVLEALGEGWGPEKQGEAVEAMVKGFRDARVQTSFPSTSMPEKKVAEKVPASAVWAELQGFLAGYPSFIQELLDQNPPVGGPPATVDPANSSGQ